MWTQMMFFFVSVEGMKMMDGPGDTSFMQFLRKSAFHQPPPVLHWSWHWKSTFFRGCSSNSGFLRHFMAFQTDLPLESWIGSRINCHVPGCHHRSTPPFAFRLPLDSEWVSRGTHKELGEGSVTKGPLWGWTTTSLRTSVNTYRLPKGWFGNPLTKARLGKVPMNII